MTNQDKINQAALEAIEAPWAENDPGYCSRWVRQVFEHALRPINIWKFREKYFGGTALDTEMKWRRAGLLLANTTPLRKGDVVFQSWLSSGHIGIVVSVGGKLMIAENSTRKGMIKDARMLTTLEKFGKIRSVGRFR